MFISMYTIHVASQRSSQSVPSRLGSTTRGDFMVPSKIPPLVCLVGHRSCRYSRKKESGFGAVCIAAQLSAGIGS
jgi:hypothetical protein